MSVAVISTCFNQQDIISDAIESVVNQTVPALHVIADDGSTDNSVEVLRGWERSFGHITVVECTNRGPAGAFNAALLNVPAQVGYVVTLCGDDWLAENFVEECLRVLGDAAAAVPGMIQVGGRSEELRLVPQRQPTVDEVWAWSPPRMWTSALFRKEVLLAAGGFHTGAFGEEDWDMWIDLTVRGHRVGFTDKTWFYYRVTGDGLTARKTREEWDAHRNELMRHHRRDTLPGPGWG